MARLRFALLSIVSLLALTAVAAPDGSPAAPKPAFQADAIAPATVAASPTPISDSDNQLHLQIQADLKKRQASSNATVTSPGGTQTGAFTALDGGIYEVTSISNYVVIVGKTLFPGQDALIGNERVSQGSSGLVANGATVMLTGATSSSASTSSGGGGLSGLPASSSALSQSVESTFVSTSTRSMMAASTISTVVTVASGASTASSAAGAATQTGNALIAAVGGIIGLMVL
ncbi:hypothetical protein LTR97_010026 [Elasticomyces elasticus]|uniref:Uncharacterized protein n=1 Tax=Elasticomyces elasticus TaxID=574655 RepID=A0AAN7ZRK3_9PEZI|nr:hypothetical protein LTR97_010026 [Elasticomyces elasticus]